MPFYWTTDALLPLVCSTLKHLPRALHWLPVSSSIIYKILLLTFKLCMVLLLFISPTNSLPISPPDNFYHRKVNCNVYQDFACYLGGQIFLCNGSETFELTALNFQHCMNLRLTLKPICLTYTSGNNLISS